MQAYRTHLIVQDPGRVTISVPFRQGQRVEVLLLVQEDRESLVGELKTLFTETQALPQIRSLNEDDVVAEITAFRSGL